MPGGVGGARASQASTRFCERREVRSLPATHLVVHCHTRQDAYEIKAKLAVWLAPKGLAFNEDKTRVVCLDEGYDFLGFNVRRYRGKLLIKPSKAAVRRIRARLHTELRSLRGSNAQAVIKKLNPIIRGRATYYRTQVSTAIFADLDAYLWRLTYKWATSSHANKPKSWVVHRYFGKFNKAKAGPVGVRRPPKRRLHAQVRLDPHRPAPSRQERSVTRRPRPHRLLGLATPESTAADQQHQPAALPSPGRSLSGLQRLALRRRPAATNPAGLGAVADQHPHYDHHRQAGNAGHG
jgi:Group II intron, maturase-specific domain